LKWWDCGARHELHGRDRWIPQYVPTIGRVDAEGNLIYAKTLFDSNSRRWLLIDGRSGALRYQGRDTLLAVSSDGKYVVSGNDDGTGARLYELPLRAAPRSLPFMMICGAAWTLVVVLSEWAWKRRAAERSVASRSQ
jgi:hypothetical protein